MEAIDALETEARALEDEAEALYSRGLTVAALVRLQRAKSKRNQAQSLFNAGQSCHLALCLKKFLVCRIYFKNVFATVSDTGSSNSIFNWLTSLHKQRVTT